VQDQYFFIHEAVAEALLCGNTEVPADHLPGYLLDLCTQDDHTDRTGLELEFKVQFSRTQGRGRSR